MGRLILKDLMPYANLRADASLDYEGFLEEVLQVALDELLAEVDRFKFVNDSDRVDVDQILDAMLEDLGNPFDVVSATANTKRKLIRELVTIYKEMGTAQAIIRIIELLSSYTVTAIISPSPILRGWELGVDVLGDGIHPIGLFDPSDFIMLWPSKHFQRLTFSVELDTDPTPADTAYLTKLVKIVKPCYMHFTGFDRVVPPPAPQHWEIGESQIGVNDDLHQ
jgi:phage tail-like protein